MYKVYFFHKTRIRFTITDASSYSEAYEKATQLREGVIAGRLVFNPKRSEGYAKGTMGSFRAVYAKEILVEQLKDARRALGIVDRILLPKWGELPFAALTRQHGLDLILDLRAAGYAEQGIRRVVNIARRYAHLAIRHRLLTSNPLIDLPLQPYVARERIASPEELRTLLALASPRMRDAITLAVNLPLRQELILTASPQHLSQRKNSGLWYCPPKAPTIFKGRPLELPVNDTVARIFHQTMPGETYVLGDWKPDKFRKSWRRLCQRATISDLRYHDLRRNAGSMLQQAHVHPGVIALLLGHSTQEVSGIYKTFESWRPALRKAVSIIDRDWKTQTRTKRTHRQFGKDTKE